MTLRAAPALASFGVALLGCASHGGDEASSHDSPDEMAGCQAADGAFVTPVRLASEGGLATLLVTSAEPERPRLGDNAWFVDLSAADGTPLAASFTLNAWMPEHNHGSLKAALVSSVETGRYEIRPIHLHMPGLWQFRFEISVNGTLDRAQLEYCITE